MIERPRMAFTWEDANTELGLSRVRQLNIPIHASVIVTDPDGLRPIRDFARDFGAELKKYEPGLHLDFFRGTFPNNKYNLFGIDGLLDQSLYKIEKTRRRSPKVSWHLAHTFSLHLRPFYLEVGREIDRQVSIANKYFGDIQYVTPHFGIWHWGGLYRIYHEVLNEFGIWHRGAIKYNRLPTHEFQLAMHDGLNHKGLTTEEVFGAMKNIRKRGIPVEVGWHFGERRGGLGAAQTSALQDERVRSVLRTFRLMMPHELLRLRIAESRDMNANSYSS